MRRQPSDKGSNCCVSGQSPLPKPLRRLGRSSIGGRDKALSVRAMMLM